MTLIRMNKTYAGPDRCLNAGEVYDVPDALAAALLIPDIHGFGAAAVIAPVGSPAIVAGRTGGQGDQHSTR
jgi:hypothetical protein